ncbi:MAG: type II toxin-antitoxin system prevent-host-death family antitoxin [Cyanobacteria bacterium J06627_28]
MEIAAGQFKAHCLRLMDQVQKTKEEIVITKYGKPIARLAPIASESPASIVGWMKDSIEITGDIVAPLDEIWDVDSE